MATRVGPPRLKLRLLSGLLVASLTLASCGNDDPSPSRAETHANESPGEQVFAVENDSGFVSRDEAAAETYARAVARSMSRRGTRAFGYAECTENPCLVTIEGPLKDPPSRLGYECETTVMGKFRGAQATVRRAAPFSCRATQTLLD